MPGGVTIRRNQIEKVFRQVTLGTSRALNRAGATMKTHMVREAAKELGAKQALIRDRIIQDKASVAHLETRVRATKKRLRLIDLGARPTSKGVMYRGRLIPSAFPATMASGHRGIFKRKLPTRSRVGRPRRSPALPIQELYGASVPFIVTKKNILQSALKVGVDAFIKNQAREIRFATGAA